MYEQSSISNIYACGDILADSPRNEPGASIGGKRIAKYIHAKATNDNELKKELENYRYKNMPVCLFTTPELAWVGTNYAADKDRCICFRRTSYLSKLAHFASPDKHQEPDNFLKICFDKDSSIITSLHYLGDSASDIIQSMTVLIYSNI